MKRKLLIQGGIAIVVLLVLALSVGVGQAYATTGCFTDTVGHWAETFICWMSDNGITTGTGPGVFSPEDYVTRAQMSVFMQRQAEIPPSTGNILVSAGFGNWRPRSSADPITFTYFSDLTRAVMSSTGTDFLMISPDLSTVLYGKSLMLTGVEFCYQASASATLNYVEINTYRHSTGTNGRTIQFSDSTTRTDGACRLYTLATPAVLTAEDGVNFYIAVNWVTASTPFDVGRTTFILKPTTTTAAPPAALGTLGTDTETILSPSSDSSAP